jgi:hypothetical protein
MKYAKQEIGYNLTLPRSLIRRLASIVSKLILDQKTAEDVIHKEWRKTCYKFPSAFRDINIKNRRLCNYQNIIK